MGEEISRVFIVEDDESVRTSLARVLRSAGLASELFPSAEAFLNSVRQLDGGEGCIVLDVQMGGISGMDLQERLDRLQVEYPVIFLTGHGDIPMSVKAMKRGAFDFLTKPVDAELLLETVNRALQFHAETLRDTDDELRQRFRSLTQREFEVMRWVIVGTLNKQIGGHMGIAEKTVKVHRGRVMQKLDVESVPELVRLCTDAGIEPMEGQG